MIISLIRHGQGFPPTVFYDEYSRQATITPEDPRGDITTALHSTGKKVRDIKPTLAGRLRRLFTG